jgi:hypothetical protein
MQRRCCGCLLTISFLVLVAPLSLRSQSARAEQLAAALTDNRTARAVPPHTPARTPVNILPRPVPVSRAPFGLAQMTRAAGTIFSGTVARIVPTSSADGQVQTVAITFRVDRAIRGVVPGQNLTINQWIGVWTTGQRYRIGESVLLFLYPPSRLGLTSSVGGPAGREGFFDLAGLPFPNNSTSAQYQLSIESVDAVWSAGVGPYSPYQVAPSGNSQPVVLVVYARNRRGARHPHARERATRAAVGVVATWSAPAPVPLAGDWVGSLSSYGNVEYFSLPAQPARTMSIAVTELDEDERGAPTESKGQPVIGMWAFDDPEGTPPAAWTVSPFYSNVFGMTRLDAQIFNSTRFLIGIAGLRGDGRPDYHYHAHVLYADSAVPSRLGVSGGAVTIYGTGFSQGLVVTAGNTHVTPLAVNAGRMVLTLPTQVDGAQDITITDPVSGAHSTMTGVLTYGADSSDNITLVQGLNPLTPVGTQAANPVRVRVVAADGLTPVAGASIGWSATNGASLSACGGTSSCNATSDEGGGVSTWVTPGATGVATITASLAPAVYHPPKSVSATLVGSSSASDIGIVTPYLSIAQGATLGIPLVARVMSNGLPRNGVTVDFFLESGSGSLRSSSAKTSSTGYAMVTLTVTNFAVAVQVSACVAPGDNPCQTFYASPVPASLQNLQPVAGSGQVIALGQQFQPLILRVVDSSSPPLPVVGAAVAIQRAVVRSAGDAPAKGTGETVTGDPAMPVVLSASDANMASDTYGLVSYTPTIGNSTGPLEVDIAAAAGTTSALHYVLQAFPAVGGTRAPSGRTTQRMGYVASPVRMPVLLEQQ